MTFLNKVATELFSASYEFRYKCIPRGHTLCQLWQLTLILQHLSWHRKPTVIKGDVSNFFPQTVSDPLLLIHFDTYCNMVAASIQTCKESRQGVKHKIVPAETHQLILCRSNRFTQIHTDTHTHTTLRSHLQVDQQDHSLSSLGLFHPPVGCGCSPSKGRNGPAGRSGCRWNSLVGPAPPKTLSPCRAPWGSHRR